jgi:hypothetical protein
LWGQQWLEHRAAAQRMAERAAAEERVHKQPMPPAQSATLPPVPAEMPGQAAVPTPGQATPAPADATGQPSQPTAAAAPQAGGPALVEIAATDICWVGVWRDGKRVMGDLLHAGDRRTVPAGGKVRVLFGNAGAVQVRAAGRDLPALGPKGQPRTLECTEAGQCAVAAPKPAAPKPVAPKPAAEEAAPET